MRLLSKLTICVFALLFGGCAATVAPPPKRTLITPEKWAADAGKPMKTLISAEWWQSYADVTLSELIEEALRNNIDLRMARAHVLEAEARSRTAHAGLLPTATVQTQASRTRMLNGFAQPFDTSIYQAGVQASYELDVWGKLSSLDDAGVNALQAEHANVEAVALSVAASVATGYINLLGLDAQLKLANATLKLRAESRELTKREYEIGYTSRLEYLQAQSEYDATAEQIPQLIRAISEQENTISILVGNNPGPISRTKSLSDLTPPSIPIGLPSELIARRPDIYRAEQLVRAQNANLIATSKQLLPSFKLTVADGIQSFSYGKFLDSPTTLWNLALNITAPFYEGGRIQAQTDIAAAQRDESIYTYEHTVRLAFAETENSLAAISRLKEQLIHTTSRRNTAAEALRIAKNRHNNGYASYLEELDAQRTFFGADQELLRLKTRLLVATVDLYRALGGGWSVDLSADSAEASS